MLRGPYIVPTMEMREAYVRVETFPGLIDHPRFKGQFPADLYAFLHDSWKSYSSVPWGIGSTERMKVVREKVRKFIEGGGREQLVAGCDTGSPMNFHSPLGFEMENLVEAGLSPMEAIQSATLRAAEMQGMDSQLGSVSVGKLADIIVVDGDPLEDMEALRRHVVHVIKDGKIVK
jgi:hypothetical protein